MRATRVSRCEGFSLVEAVISLVILSFLMLGVMAGTLAARKSSEATVHSALAEAVSLGFLEQLRSIDYTTLRQMVQGDESVTFFIEEIRPVTVAINPADFIPINVPLDAKADGSVTRYLDYSFRPQVLIDSELPLLTMIIEYKWKAPLTAEERSHTLVVSRSAVTQF